MNKESFIELLKDLDMWGEAITWCKDQETLKDIFRCAKGGWWVDILIKCPEFAKHCDWSKLVSWDWYCLLERQPQLAKHFDGSKFDGWDWSFLLKIHPQLAKYCDWNKLDPGDWEELLEKQPQLAKYKQTDTKMSKECFIALLKTIDVCDEAITWCENQETLRDIFGCVRGDWWADLLIKCPEFASFCDWSKLVRWNWYCLLEKQPQLAKHYDRSKLNGWDWSFLLTIHPQLVKYCDCSKLDDDDWKEILGTQPQLAKYRQTDKK